MKKTLQECKEIVARESGRDNWDEVMGSFHVEKYTDLANKMYYEQSEWIRVEDRLPESTIDFGFLNCLILRNDKEIKQARFDLETQRFQDMNFDDFNKSVTHWMPLPSPPKQQ